MRVVGSGYKIFGFVQQQVNFLLCIQLSFRRNRTSSFILTFTPNSVTIIPFTVTNPAEMYLSASRREQTPALDINRFSRISPVVAVFFGLFPGK
jgi:hypothetical protein